MRILSFALAALLFGVAAGHAQTKPPFTLPPLPYEADALSVAIDGETMTVHHGKHHQAYVDALNAAVEADAGLKGQTLEVLVAKAGSLPKAVRDNAGGHWNHSFYWTTMAPPALAGKPSAELSRAIDQSFGSFDAFKAAFKKTGTDRFGSGWGWLIVGADGRLAVTSTPNQDNPLMDVAEIRGTPILGTDVWEHAYYLKYQNRRADYLDAWWRVVNWTEVSRRFAEATAGRG